MIAIFNIIDWQIKSHLFQYELYHAGDVFCRKLWDALTGDELHSFEHKHIVRACAFSEVDLNYSPLVFLYLV